MTYNLKLTRRQRHIITRAFCHLSEFSHSKSILEHWARQERNGYGCARDKVSQTISRALCVKWFLMGVQSPDVLLRDTYAMRGAAIYMYGLGARSAHQGRVRHEDLAIITNAVEMYDAVFAASLADNKLDDATTGARHE